MHLIYHLILHILLKFHILIILFCIGNLTEALQKFNIIPRAKQLINWLLNVTPKLVPYTIVLKQQNVPFKIYHFSMKKKISICYNSHNPTKLISHYKMMYLRIYIFPPKVT